MFEIGVLILRILGGLLCGIGAVFIVYAGFRYSTTCCCGPHVEKAKMRIITAGAGIFIGATAVLASKLLPLFRPELHAHRESVLGAFAIALAAVAFGAAVFAIAAGHPAITQNASKKGAERAESRFWKGAIVCLFASALCAAIIIWA